MQRSSKHTWIIAECRVEICVLCFSICECCVHTRHHSRHLSSLLLQHVSYAADQTALPVFTQLRVSLYSTVLLYCKGLLCICRQFVLL